MDKIFLSVVIPAYNEARRIPKTLVAIDHYLRGEQFGTIAAKNGFGKTAYEVLVVSDGSTDTTADIVRKFQQDLIKNLNCIDNKENHGKGWVVRQGMLAAKGKYRLFTDADNSTSIDQVEKLLPFAKGIARAEKDPLELGGQSGYDVVIGSRGLRKSAVKVAQPLPRVIFGKLSNLLIQMIAVPGIWDTQCGFKLFTDTATKEIFSKTLIDRWGFDFEALALARKLGFFIKEVPIIWENDAESKVTLKGYLNTFRELFRVRMNLWMNKYNLTKTTTS